LKKLEEQRCRPRAGIPKPPDHGDKFMLLKQLSSALLGLFMLAILVFIWAGATRALSLFVERVWCWQINSVDVCHLRGAWVFLIWCVIALVNLLIIGLLIERVSRPIDRNGRGET
jgi:hypothetical protein